MGLISEPVIGELLIIFVIVLLLFGPERLPRLSRAIGDSVREFKDTIVDKKKKKLADKN